MNRARTFFQSAMGALLGVCCAISPPVHGNWIDAAASALIRADHTLTLLPNGTLLALGGRQPGPLATASIFDPAVGRWRSTASASLVRSAHTATLLPSGKVLVVGGDNLGSSHLPELFDPISETWSNAAALPNPGARHTATLLNNGRVLIVGSTVSQGSVIYDPASDTWSAGIAMNVIRYAHTATLLQDGTVLVSGGISEGTPTSNNELFTPNASGAGSWSNTSSLSGSRWNHRSVQLADGRSIATTGVNVSVVTTTERYSAASGTWTADTALQQPRTDASATLLPNGKALIVGGRYFAANSATVRALNTELYTPASMSGQWTSGGSLPVEMGRYQHAAALLANGQLLIDGGLPFTTPDIDAVPRRYESATSSTVATANLAAARYQHTSTTLQNGKVLVVGGFAAPNNLASAVLFDPVAGTWSSAGSLTTARRSHTATLLFNGKVLVVAGQGGSNRIASAEIYDPATNAWSSAGAMPEARSGHAATLLANGKVLVSGGSSGLTLASAMLYDPATNSWTSTSAMGVSREGHSATRLGNGKVLVAGGFGSSTYRNTSELYDPVAGTWSAAASFTDARSNHGAVPLGANAVMIAGGNNAIAAIASAEIYDATTNTWSATASLAGARTYLAMNVLPSGHVLASGGGSAGVSPTPLSTAELFDATTNTWVSINLLTARAQHSASVLANGDVLIVGGNGGGFAATANVERFSRSLGFDSARRPTITTNFASLVPIANAFSLSGTKFLGDTEAASGNTTQNATNYPLVQLVGIDTGLTTWLRPAANSMRSATSYTSTNLANVPLGAYWLTMYVNGIPSVAKAITVTLNLNQSITGFTPMSAVVFGTTQTLAAVGGASGNALTFSVVSGPCAVSGTTLSYTGVGKCVVAANQAGDSTYRAADQVTANVNVNQAPQAIVNFAPTSPVSFGAALQNLSATGGASGNAIVFSIVSGSCALVGSALNYTGTGTCVVAANQAGNANYSAAPQVTANVVINPATQTITAFNPLSPVVLGADPQVLSAVGGASGNPVTFSLVSGPCGVLGNVLSHLGGGLCVVAANQAGNANYAAASPLIANVRVIASLNIDLSPASGTANDAATDGVMILRYIAGFTGTAITDNAMHPSFDRSPEDVPLYLASIRGALDVNGDGNLELAVDGLLIVRHMRGLREATGLFNGVAIGTVMTAAQIESYLALLMPL